MTDPPRTCQLLLVEDNDELRSAMAELLDELGYEVLEAGNGHEAIAIARTRTPSLILLDLMMPVMDGWTFLHHRQSDPALSAIPVVVMTAQRDPTLPHGATVVDVLTKPPTLERLVAVIERACGSAQT